MFSAKLERMGDRMKALRGVPPVSVAFFFALHIVLFSAPAGPAFLTDDPEPVEYPHREVYVATQSQEEHGGRACRKSDVEFFEVEADSLLQQD